MRSLSTATAPWRMSLRLSSIVTNQSAPTMSRSTVAGAGDFVGSDFMGCGARLASLEYYRKRLGVLRQAHHERKMPNHFKPRTVPPETCMMDVEAHHESSITDTMAKILTIVSRRN